MHRALTPYEQIIGRRLSEAEHAQMQADLAAMRARDRAECERQCEDMRAMAVENDTALLHASEDERQLHRLKTERISAEVAGRFADVRAFDREISHIQQRIAKARRAAA